jgi:glutathione S-transferase
MRLIGMMDSPYVRRVAVSLKLMGLRFSHEPVSVFRQFEQFAQINPVVKAPTLVTGDGITLMESTLILEYLDHLVPKDRCLTSYGVEDFARAQRVVGLALAACEKTVQIVYELTLRPVEKHHQPWIDRLRGQLLAAYRLLEVEVRSGRTWLFGPRPLQADVSSAVAWRFSQSVLADVIVAADYPALSAFSERAESLPEFLSSALE